MAITANVEFKAIRLDEASAQVGACLTVCATHEVIFRVGRRLYYDKATDCVNYTFEPSSHLIDSIRALAESGKIPSTREAY